MDTQQKDMETLIGEALEKAGYDRDKYSGELDATTWLFYAVNRKTGRRKIIGLLKEDKQTIVITRPVGKGSKTEDRKCINFYLPSADYKTIMQAAALSGQSVSQYCRDVLLQDAERIITGSLL